MDAAIQDEAVPQDKMRATETRVSPSVGDTSERQARELNDIARKISEAYPDGESVASSSGKSMVRRPSGALRTARLLMRKLATAGIAIVRWRSHS